MITWLMKHTKIDPLKVLCLERSVGYLGNSVDYKSIYHSWIMLIILQLLNILKLFQTYSCLVFIKNSKFLFPIYFNTFIS